MGEKLKMTILNHSQHHIQKSNGGRGKALGTSKWRLWKKGWTGRQGE